MAKHHERDKLMKIIRICKIVSMEANSIIVGKLQTPEAFPLDTLTVLAPYIHVSAYSTVYIRETVNRHYPLPSAGDRWGFWVTNTMECWVAKGIMKTIFWPWTEVIKQATEPCTQQHCADAGEMCAYPCAVKTLRRAVPSGTEVTLKHTRRKVRH